MEISITNIQNSSIHLMHMPRLIDSPLQLERVGFIHQKTQEIDVIFHRLNIFFVLNGHGYLVDNGKTYELNAPVAVWNWPGTLHRYWPDPAWDEMFLGFNANVDDYFRQHFNADFFRKPYHPIPHPAGCMRYITELQRVARQPLIPGAADRIDQLALLIILEAFFPQLEESLTPVELKLLRIADYLHENLHQDVDLTSLAAEHGMSYSTFLRYWQQKYPDTPLQYLRKLRNTMACELLRDYTLSISDIAQRLGFKNQFYFAKFFRDMNGITPSGYRTSQKTPL